MLPTARIWSTILSPAVTLLITSNLNATVVSDFSPYSQVWIYDLVTGANQSTNQQTNYTNIANWYNGLTDQNLITDGRIISSSQRWTDRPNGLGTGGEPEWIQNYANKLESAGGGLLLGTDHVPFQSGINSINALIGIDPFVGTYVTPPLEAFVDSASPLFIAGLEACSLDANESCINDNSSTGFAPTGLQSNGQFLTPLAYHGTTTAAFDLAAVSSTFGSPTFPAPEPTVIALLAVGVVSLGFANRRKVNPDDHVNL